MLEVVMTGGEETRRPGGINWQRGAGNEQLVGYPQPGLERKEPASRSASVVTLGDRFISLCL